MNNQFDPFTIGFEKFFNQVKELEAQTLKAITYPPYNIKKTGDNSYVVEMAVAGFGKQDIEITLEENTLKVNGKIANDPAEESNYVFKGIAERPFARSFTLADSVEIKNAELINGMLRIFLDNVVPEKKARKVNINERQDKGKGSYGYLAE
jgi:molecular chaperone IbpA